MNKRHIFIILLLIFPFLLSFSSNKSSPTASYLSPEGIQFSSYSIQWDKKKLIDLYKELIKNTHGEELQSLEEINIYGHAHSSSLTKGSYHALTKTISLYQGDKFTEVTDYDDTLSHEYGHHFAYYYFPSHHFPFSEWSSIRGLDVTSIYWDAFWNYNENHHAYYPQEIFADDYVLLFGATKQLMIDDVHQDEIYYIRTEHENQSLPNVLENKKLIKFIENETGLEFDDSRLLKKPELVDWDKDRFTFSITPKANVAYRLTLTSDSNSKTWEFHQLTSDATGSELLFNLEDIDDEIITNPDDISFNVDVVDLSTSLGLETEKMTINKSVNDLNNTDELESS